MKRPGEAAKRRLLGLLIGGIPDPLQTYEQWRRAIHQDLPELTAGELQREAARGKLWRIVAEPDDGTDAAWWRERLSAVGAEIQRRRKRR